MIKLKKLNPNSELSARNMKDINDAIQTAIEYEYIPFKSTLNNFSIKKKILSLKEILNNDDYSSWGQWDKGELENLNTIELIKELNTFRGNKWTERALQWLKDDSIPAIVIFPELGLIGDGRGRVSLAVGMNITKLPVILLELNNL